MRTTEQTALELLERTAGQLRAAGVSVPSGGHEYSDEVMARFQDLALAAATYHALPEDHPYRQPMRLVCEKLDKEAHDAKDAEDANR